jgi:hypothetical protein
MDEPITALAAKQILDLVASMKRKDAKRAGTIGQLGTRILRVEKELRKLQRLFRHVQEDYKEDT